MPLRSRKLSNETSSAPSSHPIDVRRQLADATRPQHESLHRHVVLRKLMAPCLSRDDYKGILEKHLAFYTAAERTRERFCVMPQCSFAPDLARLKNDIETIQTPPLVDLQITNEEQTLGVLYVLHGSRFGAKQIARALRTSLPQCPHLFFARPMCTETWKNLIAQIEDVGHDAKQRCDIMKGAQTAFTRFGQVMHGLF